MKLHELKQAHKRKSDYHEFIYKEWDGFEPDGFYVKPFEPNRFFGIVPNWNNMILMMAPRRLHRLF
jgi:hypothetical protein